MMGEPARAPASAQRAARQTLVGTVTSDRMQKTIVVRVDRLVRHPLYQRVLRRGASFKVHDETNRAKVGDRVRIMATRPLSKDKRWRLVEVLAKASTAPAVPDAQEAVAAAGPEAPSAKPGQDVR
jgi:small subunit ribosomal protein S17